MKSDSSQHEAGRRQKPLGGAEPAGGLFAAARAGDRRAQETIVSWIGEFARHVCRHQSMSGVPELDWEDIAQEAGRVFFSGAIDRFRPGGPERSFLYSVVRTTYLHHTRGAWRRRRREESFEVPQPNPGDDVERRTLLERILVRLPEDCRRLLERLYYDGSTYEELAVEFEIAIPSVRARASRCIGKAREILT